MAQVLIKISDSINSFTAGDVLVYCEDKTFKTLDVTALIEKKLKAYETERTELVNELSAAKERYLYEITRFGNLVDELEKVLKGGKE